MNFTYRVPRKTAIYWLIGNIFIFVLFSLILGVLFKATILLEHYQAMGKVVVLFLWGWLILATFVHPFIKATHYGYEVDGKKIQIKSGVYIRKTTIIPVVRVQYVTIQEGPLSKRFHFVNVQIATSNGVHSLPAVKKEVAIDLCKYLNEWIEERTKEELQHEAE